jgi:hypothetical protein
MVMSKPDGGPAFPVLHSIDGNWVREPCKEYAGMTLRDYFAAAALPAIIADPWYRAEQKGVPYSKLSHGIALDAYAIADAMLAERAK